MSAIFPFTRLLLLPAVLLLFACDGDEKQQTSARKPPDAKPSNIYTVKSGDTLYAIGVKYKINYQTLAQLNRIAPPYTLAVGQRLKLPVTVNSSSLSATVANTAAQTEPSLTYSANLTESEFKKQQAIATEVTTEVNTDVESEAKTAAPSVYVVQKNETLYAISRRFGLTPQRLAALNNIAAPEQLHAGQKLKIFKSKQKHSLSALSENLSKTRQNTRDLSQKTSIISINNESMLKLYHQLTANGKILKNFHASGNRGIEISGKLGQAVKAVAAGKVVAVKPAIYGYGVFIVIQHAEGYISSYANNSVALVQVGQHIKQGQVIAQMGQIGRNVPSVKFEVRKDGQFSDPLQFLAKQK
jgi:lipoprotein NlpD